MRVGKPTKDELITMCNEIVASMVDGMEIEDLIQFYAEEKHIWLDNLDEDEIVEMHMNCCNNEAWEE